jgi:hypothetical protein
MIVRAAPVLGDGADGSSTSRAAGRARDWAREAAAAEAPLAVRRFREEAVLERAD